MGRNYAGHLKFLHELRGSGEEGSVTGGGEEARAAAPWRAARTLEDGEGHGQAREEGAERGLQGRDRARGEAVVASGGARRSSEEHQMRSL